MPKLHLLAVLLLLFGGFFALWRSQSETIMRDMPEIRAVTIGVDGRLIINGALAPDCSAPLRADVNSFPENLDIQLYRKRSSLAACGMGFAPFIFELVPETASQPPYLIINDDAWTRAPDEPGADASYEAGSLFPIHVDDASLTLDASGDLLLSLRGNQAVGCDLPELYTMREVDGRIQIGVYNAMSADITCPDMLVEVHEIISLPATELPIDTLFEVNTLLIDGMETQNVNDNDKVLTHIFRVDVAITEAEPRQISLKVEGEHPDGCDLPVHVEQSRAGNTVHVEVYRKVPADMICPMILRPYQGTVQLDGEFEAGSYTINVNAHSQTIGI